MLAYFGQLLQESQMIYQSVAEIYDSIDETRGRLTERLAGLSATQQNFRPSSGGWSIAEIVEHLAIMEERLLGLMTLMVKKAESAAPESTDAARPFNAVSLDQFAERSRQEKFIAPETVQPSGQASIQDSLERMRQSRARLKALQPRLEATDFSTARYPHPAFGPLDLYHWLVLIGVHEERHLRQIEALISSPEYQATAVAASTAPGT
jgi:uncharacterized damage-inducible protein DinB